MPEITLEQAIFLRSRDETPRLRARSAGFVDGWLPQIEKLLLGFGDRPVGVPCPSAIFGQPLGKSHVAIVQVADQAAGEGLPALGFHVLVLPRAAYRGLFGDLFALTDRFPPPWQHDSAELPVLTMPAQPLPARTVADVQKVLKRVKAGALSEGENPAEAELNVENSESPALLGGVQILVDGGKLVFVRATPDPDLIRGLWLLLPGPSRCELWPATFAFSNALGFDALVVRQIGQEEDYRGYTSEQQAADYPAGRYELSLQTAAEAGDQPGLDALFGRRSGSDMLRLAILMVVSLSIAVFFLRYFRSDPVVWPPEQRERAANAAAIVANGNPWTAIGLHEAGRYRRAERVATAAAIVAIGDPFGAAVQARMGQARYVDIWKKVE